MWMSQTRFKVTIPAFAWPKTAPTSNCRVAVISGLECIFYETVAQ